MPPAVGPVDTAQHHLGHGQLGVQRRLSHGAQIQRHPVGERLVPRSRDDRDTRSVKILTDPGVPPGLLRIARGELVHDDGGLIHEAVEVPHFLLGQRSLFLPFVVPVPAEDLAYGPETQLGCLGHEYVFVAVQKRADLKFCEQPGPAVIDDDVGHALEKFKNRKVFLFAEVDAHAFIGGVAADHGHSLQPGDRIAQVGVDLDASCHTGLIKAADGQRPLVWRQRLDRQPPEPDVAMGHVVIAVGQYDPVGRPGGGIDGRKSHRHVGLSGPAETGANGYHARLERGLADAGHRLAPPLRRLLALGALTLAGRDDKAVPQRPP